MIHWFKTGSDVRKADRVLNENLGGTATLYLVADAKEEGGIADPRVLRSLEDSEIKSGTEKPFPWPLREAGQPFSTTTTPPRRSRLPK
jgi:hypothetical protein